MRWLKKQEGTANITGKVIDQYGNPVSGVVITMKNTDFKTVTGDDGTFEFQYKKGDMLRFLIQVFT